MTHSTHVISLSPQAKWYVLILFKYLVPLTCLKILLSLFQTLMTLSDVQFAYQIMKRVKKCDVWFVCINSISCVLINGSISIKNVQSVELILNQNLIWTSKKSKCYRKPELQLSEPEVELSRPEVELSKPEVNLNLSLPRSPCCGENSSQNNILQP